LQRLPTVNTVFLKSFSKRAKRLFLLLVFPIKKKKKSYRLDTIFSGFEFPQKMVLKKPVMSLEVSLRWPAISIQHKNQNVFPQLKSCVFLLNAM